MIMVFLTYGTEMNALKRELKPYPAVIVYLVMSMLMGRDVYVVPSGFVYCVASSSDRVVPPSLNLSIFVKL
jgi:hypothetical protein